MKYKRVQRFFVLFLTAVILTWPLVLHLPTHLPLGTETAATVPLFNLWTLIWNARALAHGYAGYWNAPIFYPEPGTFALSDPQPLTGAIFALPYFLSGNPVLAYNLVFLGFLVLNGVAGVKWGMVLAGDGGEADVSEANAAEWNLASVARNPLKRNGEEAGFGRRAVGLVIGVFAQSLPFVTREWGVLQLVAVFPVFFALAALVRFGKTPTLRAALALGAWVGVTFLTSSYYGLFLILFLPLGGIVFVQRAHFRRRAMLNLLAGVALTVGLLLPILPAQARLTAGYSRSGSTIQKNSAWGVDYLRLDGRMWVNGIMPWLWTERGSGQKLYPGTGLLIFAGVGLWLGWRSTPREAIFCLLGTLVAMGISFGLNLALAGVKPYQWITEYVPGFERLRSPFRMGMLMQVFLVGLAGVGVRYLQSEEQSTARTLRLRKASEVRKTNFTQGATLVIGLILILEVVALPVQVWDAGEIVTPPEWVAWLEGQPDGAAAIIPFAESGSESGSVKDFEATAVGMVHSLFSGKPLANGYSGFFPQVYRDLSGVVTRQFPNENSLTRLREAGVVYLIVDRGWLTAEDEAVLFSWGLEMGWVGEETVVFVVP